MIEVTVHGASGAFAALVWVLTFFGMPVAAFCLGRGLGRDEGRWAAWDEEDDT